MNDGTLVRGSHSNLLKTMVHEKSLRKQNIPAVRCGKTRKLEVETAFSTLVLFYFDASRARLQKTDDAEMTPVDVFELVVSICAVGRVLFIMETD